MCFYQTCKVRVTVSVNFQKTFTIRTKSMQSTDRKPRPYPYLTSSIISFTKVTNIRRMLLRHSARICCLHDYSDKRPRHHYPLMSNPLNTFVLFWLPVSAAYNRNTGVQYHKDYHLSTLPSPTPKPVTWGLWIIRHILFTHIVTSISYISLENKSWPQPFQIVLIGCTYSVQFIVCVWHIASGLACISCLVTISSSNNFIQ